MHLPSWNTDTAATVQAVAAIAQGVLTILALIAAIGIPWWQLRQGRTEDRKRRASELAGLRLGLHTEVGVVALQCLMELDGWTKAIATSISKNVRTAKLPRLTIYDGNTSRIGLLTRNEIVSLIGFSGTLHDISIVVGDMERQQAHELDDRQTLQMLFSNACGTAANFLEAVPGIEDAEKDRAFIQKLKAAHSSMMATRTAALNSFLASQ